MLKTCVDRRFARFGLRETRLEHEAKEKTAKARPPGALAERSLRSILQLSPVGSEERKESNAAVVGFGAVCLDYLACVSEYPKPDDKIRYCLVHIHLLLSLSLSLSLTLSLNTKLFDSLSLSMLLYYCYWVLLH